MKKVLITGGAGTLGRCVSEELLKRNYAVRIFDLQSFDCNVAPGGGRVGQKCESSIASLSKSRIKIKEYHFSAYPESDLENDCHNLVVHM